jgi:WD40 repeat protein
METLLALVQERNARETTPFVEIHAAHQRLWHQVEVLQTTCDSLERQLVLAREQGNDRFNEKDPHRSESAALRNERKLKEWVERLEERIQKQTAQQEQDTQKLQEIAKERDTLQSLQSAQETTMIKLQEENEQQNRAIEHLTTQTNDSQQRAKLAEQQYVGLKDAIRVLQEENDSLKKENRELETRLVSEKERLSAEMNTLTDLVERQKRQAEMAQTYQQQEEKRKSKSSWFGLSSSSNTAEKVILPSTNSAAADPNAAVSPTSSAQKIASPKKNKPDEEVKRPPPVSAKVPIKLKHLIQAHYKEASCVRYDDLGSDTLVTGGSVDGTVKVWNTANGSAKTSFKGGSHNAIIAVDSTNHLVAGGGTDKTVRVWNHTTNRMVHHLVGHSNKITSLRFFGGERGIVTAASDRQIKVWDISRQTYRQTATMHLNSTANSIDTTFDSRSLGSGHTDGSLQFWDMQTGQKSAEFKRKSEGTP